MTAVRSVGIALALLLALTPAREWLVSTMTGHMLGQIPLLLIAGALVAVPASVGRRGSAFNPGGAPGLLLSAAVLTTWMIPRALDLAVTSASVAHLESASVLISGALLRYSWRRAGPIGQAFFVGNLTWMAAVVGLLLRDAPVRVCTTYLVRDQFHAGTGLLLLAAAVGGRWFMAWLALPTARTSHVWWGNVWRSVP